MLSTLRSTTWDRGVADSLLEGTGFEPSVPPKGKAVPRRAKVGCGGPFRSSSFGQGAGRKVPLFYAGKRSCLPAYCLAKCAK